MVDHTVCPTCEGEYSALGMHWARSDCGFPSLTDFQEEIFNGVMFNKGSLNDAGSHARFTIHTQSKQFADWLFEQFGPHSSRVGEETNTIMQANDGGEGTATFYIFATRSNPWFARARSRWYADGRRTLPDWFEPTPTSAALMYALCGWVDANGFICLSLPDAVSQSRVVHSFAEFNPTVRKDGSGKIVAFHESTRFKRYVSRSPCRPIPGLESKLSDLEQSLLKPEESVKGPTLMDSTQSVTGQSESD